MEDFTMQDIEYGHVKIKLNEILEAKNISINKLAYRSEMQRSQIRKYCKNEVQRLDISILARLCYSLECTLEDLIEYVPPRK